MFPVTVLCVGGLKEPYLRQACGEYEKRLKGFCRLQVVEIPEYRLPENPSPAQIAAALEKEGGSLRRNIPRDSLLLSLCIEGEELDSRGLSTLLEGIPMLGKTGACFVIGSSHGLDPALKQEGRRLSMSRMTFPHQLARVMLLEQIYRAFQISAGGKYHK